MNSEGTPTPMVTLTYYTELISSWCFWAEPAWAQLKEAYADSVKFQWKLALMDQSGLPVSRAQCEWFYRRSGTLVRSPEMLNSGWYEPELKEYLAPNLVAEAGKDFGISDDRIRLALVRAALVDGKRVGQWPVAVQIGAEAAGIDFQALLERAQSEAVLLRARASTAEFHAMKATQRPTFLIESSIGDRVMLSGLATAEPIAVAIDAMLVDVKGYRSFAAHFGGPPSI